MARSKRKIMQDAGAVNQEKAKKTSSKKDNENSKTAPKKAKKAPAQKSDIPKEEAMFMTLRKYGTFGVTFEQLSAVCGYGVKTKDWASLWVNVKKDGLVEKIDGGKFVLTDAGLERAKTFGDGTEEVLEQPITDVEHQEFVKSNLIKHPRGAELFDYFLKEQCAISANGLAGKFGVNQNYHWFHSAFKELKDLGIVEKYPEGGKKKKWYLGGRAFLDGQPREVEVDEDQGPACKKTEKGFKPKRAAKCDDEKDDAEAKPDSESDETKSKPNSNDEDTGTAFQN